jgi:ATP phosphoribosyltransferase regulatory subunit
VPIRVGAELYGHAGVECDIELVCLMHASLVVAEIGDIQIVLGHVGLFRSLLTAAKLDQAIEQTLFDAVQRKAYSEIDSVLEESVADKSLGEMLRRLSRLSGGEDTLLEAIEVFDKAPAAVKSELQELVAIVEGVKKRLPEIVLNFDLCELRGYEYHTGIVFAAYTPEYGRAVAKGGRYDHIGEVFGRARPASGFDSDLKTLAKLSAKKDQGRTCILAPNDVSDELLELVTQLRADGFIVINNLCTEALTEEDRQELSCDRRIVSRDGKWLVEDFD